MEFGKVEYHRNSLPTGAMKLKLTLVGQGDEDTLKREGLAGLRRKRIVRLTSEALLQGGMLSYEDLSSLLFTSLATLKRDVKAIEALGVSVPIRGRRKGRRAVGVGHGG